MSTTMRCLFAAAALAALPAAYAAAGTLIRLQPEDGATYRYVMTQKQTMNTQMGPMGSQSVDNAIRADISQTVTGRNADGSTSFDVTYDRMVLDVTAGPTVMHYDSADDGEEGGENPAFGVLDALIGKTFTVTMSERNHVLDVTGFETMWDSVAGELPEDPMARQMTESFKKAFSADSMKQLMQSGGAIFPEGPVRPGDTWNDEVSAANPILGDIAINSSYVYEQAEKKAGRDCLRVAVDMAMSFGGTMPMVEAMREMFAAQGADVSVDIEVGEMKGSGTLWVDRATGMTVSSDIDQAMAMTVNLTMSAPEQPEPLAMAMVIDMDQKILFELAP